jgi:hypothetical protein
VGIVEGGRVPTLGDAFTTGFCVDLSRMSFEFIAAAWVNRVKPHAGYRG